MDMAEKKLQHQHCVESWLLLLFHRLMCCLLICSRGARCTTGCLAVRTLLVTKTTRVLNRLMCFRKTRCTLTSKWYVLLPLVPDDLGALKRSPCLARSELNTHGAKTLTKNRSPKTELQTTQLLNLRKAGVSFENGDDPHDFIQACEDNITASNASDDAALKQIALCLTGSAYRWWQRSRNSINTWHEFKTIFLENFLPVDNELRLEDTLRERIQYDNESFAEYIDAIETVCSKMKQQPSEVNKVKLILRNIHPFFKRFFRGYPCSSMQELFDIVSEAEKEISEINRYRMLQQRLFPTNEGQYCCEEFDVIPPLSREMSTPGLRFHEHFVPVPTICLAMEPTDELLDMQDTASSLKPFGEEISSELMPILPGSEEVRTVVEETRYAQNEIKTNDEEIPVSLCEKSAQQPHHITRFVIIAVLCLNFVRRNLQSVLQRSFQKHSHKNLKEKFRNIRKSQKPLLNPHVPPIVLTWSLLPPDPLQCQITKFLRMMTPATNSPSTAYSFLNYRIPVFA